VFGQSYVTVVAIDYAIRHDIPLLIELVTDLASPFYYVPWPWSMAYSSRPMRRYCFVCISEKLMNICLDEGIQAKDIWCRPNPVDEKLFHPVGCERRNELRSKLSKFGPEDKVIAYIAKFRPSKNHVFLAELLSHLPEEYKLIVGGPVAESGPEAARSGGLVLELEEKITELGLSGRAHIVRGFIEHVSEYYQAADVYAFPSLQEGLGTPLLESIACGTPVVANRIDGVTDLWINEGHNGFLCGTNPAEFADKLKKAAEISVEIRRTESDRMLHVAGNKVIDAEYLKLISRLTE
jgi:glycosyltransferase involved in cell wall biosynthesis